MNVKSDSLRAVQTVFVVDDDTSARESLCWLLETEGIATRPFASAETLLADWSEDWSGCLTVDVRMPGKSGLQLQQALKDRNNRMPIIVLTGHADVPVAIRAMKLGAFDFLEKPYSDWQMLRSVRAALEHDREVERDEGEKRQNRNRFTSLTDREGEVMLLVVEGSTNKSIAARLGISEKTVEIHRARVMQKTGSGSLSELVRRYLLADIG